MFTLLADAITPTNPTQEAALSTAAVGRHGALALRFAQEDGRSYLAHRFWRPPLQIMRAVAGEAGVPTIYLLSPTGGVVQGDRYEIEIGLAAGAQALVTTQAATKVYRMPDGEARQHVRLEVGAGAVLEFVPDALILFAGSDLASDVEVVLHPGALLILHDLVMPGRLARGEVFAFRSYRSKLVVRDEDGLILYDAMRCRPEGEDWLDVGLLEGHPCWGSWYLLGDMDAWGIDAGGFCREHQAGLTGDGVFGSLSPLSRRGLAARMAARRLAPIYTAFERLRQAVNTAYLDRPMTTLRK